eukprot:TRINITY_DN2707_c0_g1_i1.p1 TRINITY_DN2707_c0_g1~~TRINITY_DN2707_c0_g1_i1.p1  ORF type:complete len:291 (+),score=53.78 TRINITY_DN2707_c0_g1_i1:966-1838(+)
MKMILYGVDDQEPNAELITQLASEAYKSDLFSLLVHNLPKLEFESRKDAVVIINALLRRQVGTRWPTVEYFGTHREILDTLVQGYETADISLNCGSILRECIRHEALAAILLQHEYLSKFYTYVETSNFDVASDAFATFKDLLTKNKTLSANFLQNEYERFFSRDPNVRSYTSLLTSANYVTRRQSIKLLGELLLDRANFNVMTRYISDPENLKLMMNLLRDKSPSIQYEAFHVFKVFVANPSKPEGVTEILVRNKAKLLEYLHNFHPEKAEEQFGEEKDLVVQEISGLQ